MISVVIPFYNSLDTLKNTVVSVLKQTYQNFEIIVVDDGSDIPPISLLNNLNDNKITTYSIPHSNANVARNYGILKSKGEYIAMLDADDQWTKDHLKECLLLIETTQADGIYSSIFLQPDRNKSIKDLDALIARELNHGESMLEYLLKTGIGAQTSGLFTTSESAKDILWDPKLYTHQDYDFVVRFARKYRFVVKQNPTVIYFLSLDHKKDFESCIRFIELNKKEISYKTYCNHYLRLYRLAINENQPRQILEQLKNLATLHKEYLSYETYISIRDPQNYIQELKDKLSYIWSILMIKVE